jgi:YesN/AraC family two-component response regulator
MFTGEMKNISILKYLQFILGRRHKYKNYSSQVSRESVDELRLKLKMLMEKKKPFLQRRYQIKDLAHDLNIPAYQLSGFMSHEIGVHFNDYINKLRIRYCEGLILSDSGLAMNLANLAFKCGFNNRNSFTKAFKKFTGQNPSDYIRHR